MGEGAQQVEGVLGRDCAGGGQCVCLHRMASQLCSAACCTTVLAGGFQLETT